MVSASRDRTIITWDLIRERRISSHQQHGGIRAAVVAQSPDMIQAGGSIMRPPQLDFEIRATPPADSGRFRMSRVSVWGHFAHKTWV